MVDIPVLNHVKLYDVSSDEMGMFLSWRMSRVALE